MMNFVILTKSSKHSKYCVAGIDVSTGDWVRLTTEDEDTDGALSREDLICIDGREAQILDEIEIAAEPAWDPIQPENVKIVPGNGLPRFVRQWDINRVLQLHSAEEERYVFFTRYKSVKPAYISDPKSLMLIKAENLIVEGKNGKAVASFDYAENRYTDIYVTDPKTYPTIDNGNEIESPEAFLVVSLGKPYPSKFTDEDVCHKFVAKIFVQGEL